MFVIEVVNASVSLFLAVTVALGITPPAESKTLPSIDPAPPCPKRSGNPLNRRSPQQSATFISAPVTQFACYRTGITPKSLTARPTLRLLNQIHNPRQES